MKTMEDKLLDLPDRFANYVEEQVGIILLWEDLFDHFRDLVLRGLPYDSRFRISLYCTIKGLKGK